MYRLKGESINSNKNVLDAINTINTIPWHKIRNRNLVFQDDWEKKEWNERIMLWVLNPITVRLLCRVSCQEKKFCYRASKSVFFFVLTTKSILTIIFRSTVNSMWLFNVWNCRFWWSIRFVCDWFRVIVVEWVCICNSMTMIDGCIYSRKSFSISFSELNFSLFFILTVTSVIWIWKKVYGTQK